MSDVSIVLLACNEAECLEQVFEEVVSAFAGTALEIVVVDDGSTDATGRLAADMAARHPGTVTIATHERNFGMGQAIRTGLLAAGGRWVGILPADGQFAPADMRRMYDSREGADAVVGRVTSVERLHSDNLFRVLLSWGLRSFIRLFHPNMPRFNGVMLVDRIRVKADVLVCGSFMAHFEILDRGRRLRPPLAVNALAITVRPRLAGHSKVANPRTILTVAKDVVRLRLSYLIPPLNTAWARPLNQRSAQAMGRG